MSSHRFMPLEMPDFDEKYIKFEQKREAEKIGNILAKWDTNKKQFDPINEEKPETHLSKAVKKIVQIKKDAT